MEVEIMTIEDKLLSSLSYLSILFLPVLFPLIVWLLTANRPETHRNALHALLLHILPTLLILTFIVLAGVHGLITKNAQSTGWFIIILIGLGAIIVLALTIYSIYKGIKILVD
ncbi:hypothetical protein IV84_GL001328 [Pediococcus damnosus]|nr:hypothetical protein IV84_GL001328 [Pediococcus damnosus]